MSIFASILRSVYKLSGAKKAFALPEDALRKEIEKQNRLCAFTQSFHGYRNTFVTSGVFSAECFRKGFRISTQRFSVFCIRQYQRLCLPGNSIVFLSACKFRQGILCPAFCLMKKSGQKNGCICPVFINFRTGVPAF